MQDNKMEQWPITFDNFEPHRLHTNCGMDRITVNQARYLRANMGQQDYSPSTSA
jgi:hypothetical protein